MANDEEEMMEQYSTMAHFQANLWVQETTGFDMAEYKDQRKEHPKQVNENYQPSTEICKPRLSEPSLIERSNAAPLKPEEPPLPPPFANRRLEQREPKLPKLSSGTIVKDESFVPEGANLVKCLSCNERLRVNVLATLVRCPNCLTVSPALSRV